MRHVLATAALLALTSVSALAADLPARMASKAPAAAAEPAYEGPPNWAGFYLGANIGYGFGNARTKNNSVTTTGPLAGFPANSFASTPFGEPNRGNDMEGAFGGMQAGYAWQLAFIVYGIEADIQGSDIHGTDTYAGSSALGSQYRTGAYGIDWYGTVRGRVGLASNEVVVYATGGLAYGGISAGLSLPTPGGTVSGQAGSDIKVGYSVGAGVEWMFRKNWSTKIEYLYVDFGRSGYAFDFGTAGSGYSDARTAVNTVKAGLNYHF